jgi:hypothetical protein
MLSNYLVGSDCGIVDAVIEAQSQPFENFVGPKCKTEEDLTSLRGPRL